ncbi:unnamed protein product [Candidula unifasciata]|uniref:Transcription factor 25 n=1 Tax=Candidula unifasciata TaxID=100452 RepID=A0A8S3YKM3_9EUPU|nr:unnamed protein product [Candidula unifasciata]
MSSRALRRLQGDSELTVLAAALGQPEQDKLNGEDEDDNDVEDGSPARGTSHRRQKKLKSQKNKITTDGETKVTENPFELLNRSNEEEEEDKETKTEDDGQATQHVRKPQAKTKKKKRKNKQKQQNNEETRSQDHHSQEPVDEVEASVQEVNRLLGDPGGATRPENSSVIFSTNAKPLLHIDYRNLNAETELKRLFGSEVVRGEQTGRNRRHRNRPLQRSSRLVQVKDTWHSTGGSGLSMKYLDQTKEFVFEHSPAYQKLQHKFADAVDSGHPDNIVNVLRENPYHIDSLIQMADLHRINEDYQTAAESIEKALYGLECAFHPLLNLAAGNCYLSYKRVENRALFLCLFKHILNLGRRGCNRTAFEFCKLLLSLDPDSDPLDCMSMIDYYALRSEQFEHLVQLEQEVLSQDSMRQVPNFALSIPLAYFKIESRDTEDTKTADQKLQDSLLFFPMILTPLLDECSVQPDKRVSSHSFFSTEELNDSTSELRRLVTLYVKRCASCWKEPEVIAWLERNVLAVLDIVDTGTDPRLQIYPKLRKQRFRSPPLSLLRHYFLSEIAGIGLPRQYLTTPVLNHDPFPPVDTIRSYSRPTRPTVASQDHNGILRSLLQSLLPSYNPYEPADEARRRQHEDDVDGTGVRGIPHNIQQSVNAVMQAMRQLLARQGPLDNGEVLDNQEQNDEEWEDGNQE